MASVGNIKSIKQSHSVKEAVVSFEITPCMSNPLSYKNMILEGGTLYGIYHRFEPLRDVTINYDKKTDELTVKKSQENGFKMISFIDGEIAGLIQGVNQVNKAMFTFNTLKYDNWSHFWDYVKENVKKIVEFDSNYMVKSFSLLYVDEFRAVNPNEFQISQLFNLKSQYVPKVITDGSLLNYNITSQKQDGNNIWAENIVVKIDDVQKSINIINNISYAIEPMSFPELLKDSDFDSAMQFAHNKNKDLLKDLLNAEVSKMIGL